MTGSYFEPVAEGRWQATGATGSPWDLRLMHAGPPSALLVRAVERHVAARPDTSPLEPARSPVLARVCVEILGPLPVGEVEVGVRTLRPGRSVVMVEAVMSSADRPLLRATVWVASPRSSSALPPPAGDAAPLPVRPDDAMDPWLFPGEVEGYVSSMDMHIAAGDPVARGPAAVWLRQRVPLVPDEDPSGVQRVMAVADSGNGISGVLDPMAYLYVNTDLTVHLHRVPRGEWVFLSAETVIGPDGVGVAASRLGDDFGEVGRGAQSLFVTARPPAGAP